MLVLHFFAIFTGLLLIAWSVLLYEPEERRIQDTLATWWIEIDDAGKRAGGRSLRLLQIAADSVSKWLSTIFGSKLISAHAIATSIVFSLSSLLLFTLPMTIAFVGINQQVIREASQFLMLSAGLFYIAVTPSQRLLRYLIAIAVIIYLSSGFYIIYAVLFTHDRYQDWSIFDVIVIFAGSLGGVASDFALIVVTRRLTRRIAEVPTLASGILAFVGNAVIGLLLTAIPLILLAESIKPPPRWISAMGFAAATNIYSGIMSLSVVILLVAVVIQRALWSSVQRPLYAIWRFKLLQNRKLLFYSGTVLLMVAMPEFLNVFKVAEMFFK
ncbi:MAG TPA: hypothetical protein VMU84_10475 [Thermoanaerobaculia bacterium]|nr:hypothetical protein [Thermoanaerobaculia bacterium]